MADKVRIGLIGCGNISPQYLEWCRIFEILDLVAYIRSGGDPKHAAFGRK